MSMRQVPLEHDINIAVNGPFWVEVANQEHPFTAMLISRSRGTCLIDALPSGSTTFWSFAVRIVRMLRSVSEVLILSFTMILSPCEMALREKEGEVQRTWPLDGGRGTVIIPRIISVQPREENAPLTHSLGSKQRKAAAAVEERRLANGVS